MTTSYSNLFNQVIEGLQVTHIEIPLIQRDYAQGRQGDVVKYIRDSFLHALCQALRPGGTPIDLDFVYGDVEQGKFYPLDGQQRLTTLFLLHWYLAWRANVNIQGQSWTKFTYATRHGARLFCECLATQLRPPLGLELNGLPISNWLADQSWYLYTWQHDPTIQSMLVMLDALHDLFGPWSDKDIQYARERLDHPENPAISFNLLLMQANGLTSELYIKMNSRGKPLTVFENFKAHFEAFLKRVHPDKVEFFSHQVDTQWADTFWPYHQDNLIDDEFMRYFRFVTDVCRLQMNIQVDANINIDTLAEQVYADSENNWGMTSLDFLFKSLDIWHGKNIKSEFEYIFTATRQELSPEGSPLILFKKREQDDSVPVDLFEKCCRHYGTNNWTIAQTLLLFAVVWHKIFKTVNFSRQIRILRNLLEASENTLIFLNMPTLLADVRCIIGNGQIDGTLDGVCALKTAQIANEKQKAMLIHAQENIRLTVYRLEDHKLLRGCLAVFDLNPAIDQGLFENRVNSFIALFENTAYRPELTGALLACGNYARWFSPRWTGYQFADFGTSDQNTEVPWRKLFKGKHNENMHPATEALRILLERMTDAGPGNELTCLRDTQQDFLQNCEAMPEMDWRYYFVKYPAMREGTSGRYLINPRRYGICMLNGIQLNGYYRDPYLQGILHMSGVANKSVEEPWFLGYENQPRCIILSRSNIRIECVDHGWKISRPMVCYFDVLTFNNICALHGFVDIPHDQSKLLRVQQNNGIDTINRIVLGANLLTDLVEAGL